jgi:D-glycero-D-manno-heptose 1,7-bisphosphate phosphatase
MTEHTSVLFERSVQEESSSSLVILDRDGVLTDASRSYYVRSAEEIQVIPGTQHLLEALRAMGARIVIASNQSWVGTEVRNLDVLRSVHEAFLATLPEQGRAIAATRYCIHRADAGCNCRKPQPGMIFDFLLRYPTPQDKCVLIGDSESDRVAAQNASIKFMKYAPLESNSMPVEPLVRNVANFLER